MRPRWWTLPTWRYDGRRWDDLEGGGLLNRSRRLAIAIWPFVASLAAVAVVVAAMFAIVSIADQRDTVVTTARTAGSAAADAAVAAEDAKTAAEATQQLLAEQRRGEVERQPRIDAAIDRILADNADAHAALLGEIARLLNRPVPTTATPQPRAMASLPGPAPSAAAPAPEPEPPDTTTTTCEQAGRSGRCKR